MLHISALPVVQMDAFSVKSVSDNRCKIKYPGWQGFQKTFFMNEKLFWYDHNIQLRLFTFN